MQSRQRNLYLDESLLFQIQEIATIDKTERLWKRRLTLTTAWRNKNQKIRLINDAEVEALQKYLLRKDASEETTPILNDVIAPKQNSGSRHAGWYMAGVGIPPTLVAGIIGGLLFFSIIAPPFGLSILAFIGISAAIVFAMSAIVTGITYLVHKSNENKIEIEGQPEQEESSEFSYQKAKKIEDVIAQAKRITQSIETARKQIIRELTDKSKGWESQNEINDIVNNLKEGLKSVDYLYKQFVNRNHVNENIIEKFVRKHIFDDGKKINIITTKKKEIVRNYTNSKFEELAQNIDKMTDLSDEDKGKLKQILEENKINFLENLSDLIDEKSFDEIKRIVDVNHKHYDGAFCNLLWSIMPIDNFTNESFCRRQSPYTFYFQKPINDNQQTVMQQHNEQYKEHTSKVEAKRNSLKSRRLENKQLFEVIANGLEIRRDAAQFRIEIEKQWTAAAENKSAHVNTAATASLTLFPPREPKVKKDSEHQQSCSPKQ